MPLAELKETKKRVVGTKQTLKAIEKGAAKRVYLAEDAESHVRDPLQDACEEHGVEVVFITSMEELGGLCGIQVGAAAAAIVTD